MNYGSAEVKTLHCFYIIALWCNGNTSDFDSDTVGSIPAGATMRNSYKVERS